MPRELALENYFNYFTEIEECFRRCRKTPTLLSTLDWALVESWKESGIPLEAALIGIERAFEKFRKRPRRGRRVNSLAYCAEEVLRAAEEAQGAARPGEGEGTQRPTGSPFTASEILDYSNRNVKALEEAATVAKNQKQSVLAGDLAEAAAALASLAQRTSEKAEIDLEELEQNLSALEEKLTALLTRASSVELLALFRRDVERGLTADRRKMTAVQLESLQRQFIKRRLFEHYRIPRLSLFYL